MFYGRPSMAMQGMPGMAAPGMAAPGMAAPGMAAPCPPPAACPPPVVGPSGVLNMDIGPGLLNMDMGGPELCAPYQEAGYAHGAAGRVHVVLRGDTVWRISRKYNISMQAIIQANNLRYPDVLYPGERLIIPDGLHYSNY